MTKEERLAAYAAFETATPDQFRQVVFKVMIAVRQILRLNTDERVVEMEIWYKHCEASTPAIRDYIPNSEIDRLHKVVKRYEARHYGLR